MLKEWKRRFFPTSPPPAEYDDNQGLLDEFGREDVQKSPSPLIYWIYFLYGVGMLLPWNVFITASGFFSARFSGTSHSSDFQSYFSAVANSSSFLFMTLLLWLRQKQKFNIDLSIPILSNAFVFLFYLISVIGPIEPANYFRITIFALIFTGLTTSAFQLTVMGDASKLLPKYMQAVMSGQGIAGVAVALTALITTVLRDVFTPNGTAFFYFLSAFAVTLLTYLGRILLQRQPTHHLIESDTVLHNDDNEEEEEEIAMTSIGQTNNSNITTTEPERLSVFDVVRRSKGNIVTILFVYMITLSIFPSVTSQIKPINSDIDGDVFTTIHFLIFNLGDWLGRTLPIFQVFQILRVKVLVTLAASRAVFILYFLYVKNNDFIFFFMIFIFSTSNGWLTSLVFMTAPKDYQKQYNKELVGRIMSFSLMLGLSLGGCFSFLLIN